MKLQFAGNKLMQPL